MKVFRDKKQRKIPLIINESTMEYTWGIDGNWCPCGDWEKWVLSGQSKRLIRISLKYYYDRLA